LGDQYLLAYEYEATRVASMDPSRGGGFMDKAYREVEGRMEEIFGKSLGAFIDKKW